MPAKKDNPKTAVSGANIHRTGDVSIHGESSSTTTSTEVKHNGPVYITIGPQNSGKTTILSNLLQLTSSQTDEADEQSFLSDDENKNESHKKRKTTRIKELNRNTDVTIDDQKGVYIQVPFFLFQYEALPDNATITHMATSKTTLLWNGKDIRKQYVHNQSLVDRIYDSSNNEMRWVVQRLTNRISAEEFRRRCMGNMDSSSTAERRGDDSISKMKYLKERGHIRKRVNINGDDDTSSWALFLIRAVEERCAMNVNSGINKEDKNANKTICRTMDVFIREGIFQKPSEGLLKAKERLLELATKIEVLGSEIPISWGNTNTRPREYECALAAAEKSRRPVYFVPYADREELNVIEDDNMFLPRVGLEELIRRNVGRLWQTGRYIPVIAIVDACIHVDKSLQNAVKEMEMMRKQSAYEVDDARNGGGTNHLFVESKNIDAEKERKKFTKFELDAALSKMAGYRMHLDRTVTIMPRKNHGGGNSFRNRGNFQRIGGRDGGDSKPNPYRNQESYKGQRKHGNRNFGDWNTEGGWSRDSASGYNKNSSRHHSRDQYQPKRSRYDYNNNTRVDSSRDQLNVKSSRSGNANKSWGKSGTRRGDPGKRSWNDNSNSQQGQRNKNRGNRGSFSEEGDRNEVGEN